ncbi:hypothetical protein ml_482 [Mollivirus sibericum]|uniref:hypothetical protein n=1 Tax=Mollivirus sibericum TaxID=1678078 RepID=UPI0006B2D946|nr:hypothetical protein ml_482 [Mollivirus sibericum]ALD62284.1 hypothetical protein ml_482 [Mollivirus sibericum]
MSASETLDSRSDAAQLWGLNLFEMAAECVRVSTRTANAPTDGTDVHLVERQDLEAWAVDLHKRIQGYLREAPDNRKQPSKSRKRRQRRKRAREARRQASPEALADPPPPHPPMEHGQGRDTATLTASVLLSPMRMAAVMSCVAPAQDVIDNDRPPLRKMPDGEFYRHCPLFNMVQPLRPHLTPEENARRRAKWGLLPEPPKAMTLNISLPVLYVDLKETPPAL